jgi:hypothetical protein
MGMRLFVLFIAPWKSNQRFCIATPPACVNGRVRVSTLPPPARAPHHGRMQTNLEMQ